MRHHRSLALLAATALVATTLIAIAGPAGALNVVTVTTTTDGGPGSLRSAFDIANTDGDDTEIVLAGSATYELTICPGTNEDANADGDLDHTAAHALTITGNGSTIRQTCPGERVIHNVETGALTLSNVTINGGAATVAPFNNGGGVLSFGPITASQATIAGNTAGSGGGLFSFEPIVFSQTTISGNTVTNGGGGAYSTDAIVSLNSTVSGNTAPSFGGGLVAGAEGGGTVTAVYSTIVGNGAATGANVHVVGAISPPATGELIAYGTVIADPQGGGTDCDAPVTTSLGWNFDSDGSCGFGQPPDQPAAGDPDLGPLQNNGGPTETHLPAATSTLINAIPVADCDPDLDLDQRDVSRPQGPGCDIGSVEVQVEEPGTTTTTTTPTATSTTTTTAPTAGATTATTSPPARAVTSTPAFTG